MERYKEPWNGDQDERKFCQDLETAKALSLETLALEKFKKEKQENERRSVRSSMPVYAQVSVKRTTVGKSLSVSEPSSSIQVKPRPRPGGFHQVNGLVPPPTPKRQPQTGPSLDLINLKSPVRKQNQDLFDEFFVPFNSLELPWIQENVQTKALPDNFSAFSPQLTQPPLHSVPPLSSSPVPAVNGTSPCLPPQLPSRAPQLKLERNVSFTASVRKQNGLDLIDLGVESAHPRYSILCAFDPLLTSMSSAVQEESVKPQPENGSSKEDLPYNQDYDPFDYFLGVSIRENKPDNRNAGYSNKETIYEVLTKEQSPVKAVKANSTTKINSFPMQELSLSIQVTKINPASVDTELASFMNMFRMLRSQYVHDHPATNLGFVVIMESLFVHFSVYFICSSSLQSSPKVEACCSEAISVKVVVHTLKDQKPFNFTCDIRSPVDHVISHVIVESDLSNQNVRDYVLKVWGLAEYLFGSSCLQDYQYVHDCVKLEKDVKFSILHIGEVFRVFFFSSITMVSRFGGCYCCRCPNLC